MASKQEIIDAIRRSHGRVVQSFSPLTPKQLATRVHDDEGDQWTAKHVLAHLAGRRVSYQRLMAMAEGEATPLQPGSFGIDEFNRHQVNPRMNNSVPELLEEFEQVQDELARRIEALPEDKLHSALQTPRGKVKLGDQLLNSGALHPVNHTEVVEKALGLTPATG